MRCRDAERALLEQSLGTARHETLSGLSDHLERCPACAARERDERRMLRDLASLHGEIPWEVDVGPTVMERIQALGEINRDEISVAQLGWSAATAAVWVAVLIASLTWVVPDSAPLVAALAGSARAFGEALAAAGAALLALLALPFKLAGALAKPLGAFGTLLRQLEPLGITAVAASYAAMAATIFLVVGRDLRRALPALAKNGEQRP
jgi:hypothetical protein